MSPALPSPRTKEELAVRLREHELGRVATQLAALSMNSIRISARKVHESRVNVGASRIGGRPDLPGGFEWPEWESGPMSFLAEIRIKDVVSLDSEGRLPRTGILCFFYDCEQVAWGFEPEHGAGCRVILTDDRPEALHRFEFPAGLPKGSRFEVAELDFRNELTLPPEDSTLVEPLGLDGAESETYSEFLEEISPPEGQPVNRLLGHPDQIQGDMQLECQMASHGLRDHNDSRVEELKKGARDWQMLLQLDSEEELGITWGDSGRVYLWMPGGDLRTGDFTRVRPALQCY